jgi:hypothetical protein
MVVRLSEGRDAIQAYVTKLAANGLAEAIETLTRDHNRVLSLIGDLTEEEASSVTPADEWSMFDVMRHLSASLERSRDRIETMSAGRPFEAPPFTGGPGGMGGTEYASFSELRRTYIDGMSAVLGVLRRADPRRGLDLTADHATFGPFNWLGWALYSHHVHTHDHIGQMEEIKQALRASAGA